MNIRIKYKNPSDKSKFIIEEINDKEIDLTTYCENLHKNKLCNDKVFCNGKDCEIYIDYGDGFILAGIQD